MMCYCNRINHRTSTSRERNNDKIESEYPFTKKFVHTQKAHSYNIEHS